jgi:hypothetical protein
MIKKCPCCKSTDIKKDFRKKEVYCNHCGLILNDNNKYVEDHSFETSHEPLSDGLGLKSEMAKIERKYNYKSKSKNKYDKLKSRYYYGILEDKLLDMDYCLSEALDIFNYCFLQYYLVDTDSNAPVILDNGKKHQRTQEKLVDDFLNSFRFKDFDVSKCVSRLKIPKELESSWKP